MIVCSIYCFYNPTGSHRPNVLFNVLWSPRSTVSQPQVQLAAMQSPTIDHPGRDVVFRFGHAMVKFFVQPFTEFRNKIEDKTIELGAVGVLQGCFEEASSRLQFEVASTRFFRFFGASTSLSLPLRGCFLVSSKLPPRGCLRHPFGPRSDHEDHEHLYQSWPTPSPADSSTELENSSTEIESNEPRLEDISVFASLGA